jgi:hypothetical protein
MQRVDQLSSQLSTQQSTSALQARQQQQQQHVSPSEVEQQLTQLASKVTSLEKALTQAPAAKSSAPFTSSSPSSSESQRAALTKLKEVGQVLETTSKTLKAALKDVPGAATGSGLVARLDACGQKLGQLSQAAERTAESKGKGEGSSNPGHNPSGNPHGNPHNDRGNPHGDGSDRSVEVVASASSMSKCMQEITERLQEIGEQLDCLEDEAEDSDVEEGDASAVEDVRQRLANLCEYIKQHSKFTDYDWQLRQLLETQKQTIASARHQEHAQGESASRDKLKSYADRLSLEALILVEMSQLLENKEGLLGSSEDSDPVMRELRLLISKVLNLHCKLDSELRTLVATEANADVLRVQADLMAEKILLESNLCAATFAQQDKGDQEVQPKLLATEALLRAQLDAHIGHNLDRSCDDLWSSASHLTTRCLVQGELTFALTSLKNKLASLQHSGGNVRDLSFERLKARHKSVSELVGVYQEKLVGALAVIIHKESEEMTLVEGPENVLDAVCSEVSTIMETHIQRCKERVRGASNTHTARRFDMMVSRLRAHRELVLNSVRQRHEKFSADPEADHGVELPFQSLDSSINNFGQIMALSAILDAHLDFVTEMLKMGDVSALADMEVEEEEEEAEEPGEGEEGATKALQKGLASFVHDLAEALSSEAASKQKQVASLLESKLQLLHFLHYYCFLIFSPSLSSSLFFFFSVMCLGLNQVLLLFTSCVPFIKVCVVSVGVICVF